ncbi:S9 family peptidase, partial [Bacillus amyloliquefaciens]|nr:S9 family peptidase [Bacillus amyloliquefaciens]
GEITALRGPDTLPELPGTLTEITARAEDGSTVRSWLALPTGAAPHAPVPLLLWVHGGPLGSWNTWSWRWNPWLLVAKGYAVLLPDPALSTGYG